MIGIHALFGSFLAGRGDARLTVSSGTPCGIRLEQFQSGLPLAAILRLYRACGTQIGLLQGRPGGSSAGTDCRRELLGKLGGSMLRRRA